MSELSGRHRMSRSTRKRDWETAAFLEKKAKATHTSIDVLDGCLTRYSLDERRHESVIALASQVLLKRVPIIALDANNDESVKDLLANPKKAQRVDNVCDVCDKGGKLICCDTCNLLFHFKCTRPKLASSPKNSWHCAHCIVDRAAKGDVPSAKVALRSMSRIGRGLDSGDEGGGANAGRITRTGETVVRHLGKHYAVRKMVRGQFVELERFNRKETAMQSLKPSSGNIDSEPMWCTLCFDDPRVTLCSFCGCRQCTGKHDASSLLLCDFCNEETHTYCLNPPLSTIPEEDWYCKRCTDMGHNILHKQNGGGVCGSGCGGSYENMNMDVTRRGNQQPDLAPGRRRGRPPGSGKRVNAEDDTFLTGASPIMPLAIFPDVKRSTSFHNRGAEAGGAAPAKAIEPAGIDNALSIISNCGSRELTSAELAVLSQLREWAPISDLEAALEALTTQRDILFTTISGSSEAEVEAEAREKEVTTVHILATGDLIL